jgi:hypothetical protein
MRPAPPLPLRPGPLQVNATAASPSANTGAAATCAINTQCVMGALPRAKTPMPVAASTNAPAHVTQYEILAAEFMTGVSWPMLPP